jgi:predicted glycoside hydrolase/deacetylase ChbG (UPF0249 family)
MKSLKRLIVSADDFGLHDSINEAVESGYRDGIVSSASLSVNGGAFPGAVKIAKANRGMGVGVHITLCGEYPVSRSGDVSTIIGADGRLFEDHIKLCLEILSGRILIGHITNEIEAQLRKFLEAGLTPTHIDSHRHLHLFPPVTRALIGILKRHKISAVRMINIPRYDYLSIDIRKLYFLGALPVSRIFLRGVRHTDYFAGFFRSGAVNREYLQKVISSLSCGTTEINVHPGKDNNIIGQEYSIWKRTSNWKCDWESEYKAVTDKGIKDLVTKQGVSLINYSNI